MVKFLTVLAVFAVFQSKVNPQNSPESDFSSPLDIPLFLSGNFGELRATHFHAGIDLKTQGVTGKPVYAAMEGYVSRIKIQSGGYGKSLYITHPNGYTTVYAHLDRYLPQIEDYVKNMQYNRESYEIELFPPRTMFVLNKGDLIGSSGNTGRSGGPHLHFEIRKTNGQIPVNGLKFHLPVEDHVRPEFRSVYTYSYPSGEIVSSNGYERAMYTIYKKNDSVYYTNRIIECPEHYVGFATEVYDFLNGSSNRCGVYLLQLKINDIPEFMFQIDAISFANTRFVNAHMDYELKTHEGKSVHRLFRLPNNSLPIYSNTRDNGLFFLEEDSIYNCEIIALDAYGNSSTLKFKCRYVADDKNPNSLPENSRLVEWKQGDDFSEGIFSVHIPSGALYQNTFLSVDVSLNEESFFIDTLYVHKDTEPLHLGMTLKARIDTVDEYLAEKLLFVRLNGKGSLIAEGGEFHDGILSVTTRNFGKYIITADTLAPTIQPNSFRAGGRYKNDQKFTFTIKDDLSGIRNYNAYIDDKWVLLEYDAKSGTLSYTIDAERIEPGKLHRIKIVVSDEKNNREEYENEFYF